MSEIEAAARGAGDAEVEVALACDSPRLGRALSAALSQRGAICRPLLAEPGGPAPLPAGCEPGGPETVAVAYHAGRHGAATLDAIGGLRAAGKGVVGLRIGDVGPAASDERDMWAARMAALGAAAVYSPRALLDAAIHMASRGTDRHAHGRRVAVVTFGGGSGVIATDLCAQYGLATPPPSEATARAVAELVPAIASVANPFDLTPEMLRPQWFDNFIPALERLGGEYDTLFIQLSAMAMGGEAMARAIGTARGHTDAEIAVAWTLGPSDALASLSKYRIFAFPDPMRAVATLAAVGNAAKGDSAFETEAKFPGNFRSAVEDHRFTIHASADMDRVPAGIRVFRFSHAEFGPMIGCAPGGALARQAGARPVYEVAPLTANEARQLIDRSPVLAAIARIERIPLGPLAGAIAAFSSDPAIADDHEVTIGWSGDAS